MGFAHGDYKVERDGDIILVTLVGSFNGQGAQLWTDELRAAIATFDGEPFAIIMDNKKKGGHTPKAFEISEEFNLWLCDQNMVAKAVIKPSSIAVKIDIRYVPSLKRQNIKFFDEMAEAESWIAESLAARQDT